MIQNYENTKKELDIFKSRLEAIQMQASFQEQEKENLIALENSLQNTLEEMEHYLKSLQGISYALYYEMTVNGLNPNKAVDKVAFTYDVSPSTIWKRYYPEVKKLKE